LIDFLGHEEGWNLFLADIGWAELLAYLGPTLYLSFETTSGACRSCSKSWRLAALGAIVREHGGTILPVLDLAQVAHHPQVRSLGLITWANGGTHSDDASSVPLQGIAADRAG
jgi:hypothetical protein